MEAYTYLRQVEKRLIARLETLGHPLGITARVLAKITQLRAAVAAEQRIETI